MAGLDNSWQEIDRSTPAGRALWRIYGGDPSGRAAGNSFSAENRARQAARSPKAPSTQSEAPPPPPHSPQKARTPVPRVGSASSPKRRTPSVASLRGRRTADSIQAETRQQQDALLAAPLPAPKGPCMDDKEKARLAEKMELNGRDPSELPAGPTHMLGTRKDRERQELEAMFDEALQHIQECKARLCVCDDGSPSWELAPEAVAIKRELARHVDDLKRIDALLMGA
ncbi:hypothetical protein WJX73_002811 [Symbiochloris irregularis]|uniref:Enkurin domain-containing protein n=1 Tax=Symbiochloris irregularis TaxID=706552 RepID=A0AAW1P0B5_9CHLO